jgi:hypothetical protein
MLKRRFRRTCNWGLYDPRFGWAKSGGRRLQLWPLRYARAARDQWNLAGAHLGADWKLKPIP